jgi:hypothetical protein
MSTITITITDPRTVDGLIEGGNRNNTTAEAIALEILNRQGYMYTDIYKIASITSAAFIARFTLAEYNGIINASKTIPEVKEQLDILLAEPFVNFYDSRVSHGLELLVVAGLLDASRIPELMTYERPQPAEEPTLP